MSDASDLIDYLKNIAEQSLTNANTAAGNLESAVLVTDALTPATPIAFSQPELTAPLGTDFDELQSDPDSAFTIIQSRIDALRNSWLMTYFPAAIPDGFDPLMQQILGGELITAAEQEILWERAKEQGMRDAARAEDEAVTQWASRGFAMPGGVVVNRLQIQQQELFHANADFAAQQAIKAIDLRVEAVKFAADIGTKLRLGLIDGLTRLIAAELSITTGSLDYIGAKAKAKTAAYGAITDYNRALIQKAELTLRGDITNSTSAIGYADALGRYAGSVIAQRVNAGVAEAEAYSRSAAAALSGLNGVASVINQTIA